MKKVINGLLVATVILLTGVQLDAQDSNNKLPISFYVGGAYTIAPTFNIDGTWTVNANTSANFYSLFVDLVINDNLIGRAQTSFLSVASLGDEVSSELLSGFQMNGSLGYSYRPLSSEKITLPIMATIGYASVRDDGARDAGMQVGATLGLNYALTHRLNATSTLRYLKGLEFNDGTPFDQIDLSLGVQFRL